MKQRRYTCDNCRKRLRKEPLPHGTYVCRKCGTGFLNAEIGPIPRLLLSPDFKPRRHFVMTSS